MVAWELLVGAAGLIATLIVIAWRAGAFFSELNSRLREISAQLGKFDGRLEDISVYAREISTYTRETRDELRGLTTRTIEALIEWGRRITGTASGGGSNPLSLEEIRRRDELLEKGRRVGLSREEAEELFRIMEKGARENVGTGLAFVVALLLIMLLIALLSKKEEKS